MSLDKLKVAILSFLASTAVLVSGPSRSGVAFELGAGKALNNTNTKLPGYSATARLRVVRGRWSYDAAYLRMGKSQLAEDAAISTVGVGYSAPGSRWRYGMDVITGASYSAAVWWDSTRPNESCGVEGCGRRYANDGQHFSRACHLCGAGVTLEYQWNRKWNIRAEYYGLRHMTPTFQGTVLSISYALIT